MVSCFSLYTKGNVSILISFTATLCLNAHNELDRHTFHTRMREVAPGLSKWLDYMYHTSEPTFVFWNGNKLEAKLGDSRVVHSWAFASRLCRECF